MSLPSLLLNCILGIIFPSYPISSGIVKYVTDEKSSGFPILLESTLGTMFPVVGDVIGELISSDLANTIEKNRINELLQQYPECKKCGQIDKHGLFNSNGERLCRACFKKLSNKIMLVSNTSFNCQKCGSIIKNYFVENNIKICENCLLHSFTNLNKKNNSLIIIRENSFDNIYREYLPVYKNNIYSQNRKANYSVNYSKNYNQCYDKNYGT